jgi:serine/threonine protein kinase
LNNFNETSGTPSYMAPEVLRSETYSFTADYYAIGVITYELFLGRRPIISKDRKLII